MDKQTISFRIDSKHLRQLDALAEQLERDRSYLLGEAVRSFIELNEWHTEQIKKGLRQADAGQLKDHGAVKSLVQGWRKL